MIQILALLLDGYNDIYIRAAGTNDGRPFATREVVALFVVYRIHELSLGTCQHQSTRLSTAPEDTASADEEVEIVLNKTASFFQIRRLPFPQLCSTISLSMFSTILKV